MTLKPLFCSVVIFSHPRSIEFVRYCTVSHSGEHKMIWPNVPIIRKNLKATNPMSNSITKGFVALLFSFHWGCLSPYCIGIVVSKDLSLFFRVCQTKGLSPFRLCHLLCIWCNYRAYRLLQVVPIKGFVEVPCIVPHALLYEICRIQSRICCLNHLPP